MKNIRILASVVITIITLLAMVWVGTNFGVDGFFIIFFIGPLAILLVLLIYLAIYTLLEEPIEWFFKNRKR